MNWFCRKEQLDQVKVGQEMKKEEITFEQKPPVTQPIMVKKGDTVLGMIELFEDDYRFKPKSINLMSYHIDNFDYLDEDVLYAVLVKIIQLNGAKNDN